jgi:hypothetical protein
MLMPPKALSCGVAGSLRKLYVLEPPNTWLDARLELMRNKVQKKMYV